VKAKYIIDESVSSVNSRRSTLEGDKVTHFSQSINSDENTGKVIGGRKVSNEIHGNRRPRTISNFEGLQKSVRFVTRWFRTRTSFTRANIVRNIRRKRRPPEIARDKRSSFFDTKVPSRWRIMTNFKNKRAALRRDIDFIVEKKEAITKREFFNLRMRSRRNRFIKIIANFGVKIVRMIGSKDFITNRRNSRNDGLEERSALEE